MATVEQGNAKTSEIVVSPRDILFLCPSCGKNLVVDEAGAGMVVDCPQCHTNVIVPPRVQKPASPTAAPSVSPSAAAELKAIEVEDKDLRMRLVAFSSKLKELQTQRAEINNRMASRINEINRDLVMMARLETAHQQLVAELQQLIGQAAGGAGQTRVNLTP